MVFDYIGKLEPHEVRALGTPEQAARALVDWELAQNPDHIAPSDYEFSRLINEVIRFAYSENIGAIK